MRVMSRPKISFLSRVLSAIAPAHCAICGNRLTAGEEFICGRCTLRLPRTGFERSPYDNPMAQMFWGRCHIERCSALFYYSPKADVAKLIIDLKYHGRRDNGRQIGLMMARELLPAGFFEGVTCIMPVPLASNREHARGFNQSREIARGLCEATGLPMVDGVVGRAKFVESQTMKDRWERNDNVEGVFTLKDGGRLTGQHVLIVDDIATTGATITACAREVEKAGNVKISVLTAGFVHH